MIIEKAKETMTAKERVLKTFNLEKTDRVTMGYEANEAVHMRVAKSLGIDGGNMELVLQALGVDYRGIDVPYKGPVLLTADVRNTLEIMMDGYGYHFAPTHAIQDNTPTENVIAMYAAAHKYGAY